MLFQMMYGKSYTVLVPVVYSVTNWTLIPKLEAMTHQQLINVQKPEDAEPEEHKTDNKSHFAV